MKIKCVELTEKYIKEVIALVKASWVWHASQNSDYLNLALFQEMDYEHYLRLQTLENPDSKGWVALNEKGKVVGFARIELQKADRYRAFRRYILVDDIIVSKKAKHSGVKETLLKKIEDFARTSGIKDLFARIYVFNKDDEEWFSGQHFRPVHTEYLKEL